MARSKSTDTYHHGSLKDSLVDCAIEQLGDGLDPGALSVRAIASELGVSAGAPYRHFPTAEALIAAVAARGFSALLERMRSAADNSPDSSAESTPGRRLERMGAAYVDFAAEHPQWYRAMYALPSHSLGDYPDLATASGEAFNLLEGAVAEFQATRFDEGMHPAEAAIAAWAYVHGLAGLVTGSLSSVGDDPAVLKRLMRALTQGL